MGIALKYVGRPEQGFIPGVPAADHEVETEAEAKALIASRLYERVKGEKPKED